MSTRSVLPMFPLGSVTAPGSALPLQVFEPRYVELLRQCLADERRFGTVLIERGSEVGGGDQRCDVGSFVTIASAEPTPDGRWAVLGIATGRLRVVEWLPDDPYPLAVVEPFPDGPDDDATAAALARAGEVVRAWLRRAAELGLGVPDPAIGLSDDPSLASHQLSALSPLGPLDRLDLLRRDGPTERCRVLVDLMDGQLDLLEARVGEG